MQSSTFPVEAHVLEQAYKAIRTTPPEPKDLEHSKKLQNYMDKHFPTETSTNIARRTMILAELRTIFRDWVQMVAIQKNIPKDLTSEVGGQILVSGSYRLGVNEPGADIDTICVAPKHVTREDFFTTLKDKLLKNPKVTNLVAIEGAVVPILTFDFEEINIDLQIAILPRNTIPDSLNILDDQILVDVDTATEKSLNGPRVTELMIKLTPNRESFISVLRIVRRWAKRRGLYSNKMGYLGGINWCILVCFINQLYPTAAPSTLLLRFFMVLTKWKWPLAIQLCKTHDAKLGLEVWNANNGTNRYHVMPILTPAYPSMNSSFNVSVHSLAVMKEEFKRALSIVQTILNQGADNWDELFQPSDFFAVQKHYLAVEIYTTVQEEEGAWCGFCESRIRKLVDGLAYITVLKNIRAFPKKFPLLSTEVEKNEGENEVQKKESTETTPEKKYGVCFFVACDVDVRQLRASREVNIDSSVDYFKHNDLYRWNKRTPTMDVKITSMLWKELPEVVFEDMGGRAVAKDIRKVALKKKKEALAQDNSSTKSEKLVPNPNMNGSSPPSEGGELLTEAENSELGSQSEKNIGLSPTGPMPEAEPTISSSDLPEESLNDTTPRKPLKRHLPEDSIKEATPTIHLKQSHPDSSHQSTPTQSNDLETFDKLKIKTPIAARKPVGSPRKRRKMKITFTK